MGKSPFQKALSWTFGAAAFTAIGGGGYVPVGPFSGHWTGVPSPFEVALGVGCTLMAALWWRRFAHEASA